jgi:hypothetical protein
MGSKLNLLDNATATVTGNPAYPYAHNRTFHVVGSVSSGAGSATVIVEVSNDGANWLKLKQFDLTLEDPALNQAGYFTDAPWQQVRGRVSAISGTGATVSLTLGQ